MERFVEITSCGQRVSVQNGWLVVRKWKGEEVGRVPLDDLSSLMLSDKGLTISAAVLAELAQRGIPLIVCDKRHLPIGIMQSLDVYHKQSGTLIKQISAGAVVRKQLWQMLVRTKVMNQARILKWRKLKHDDVEKMAMSVRSGDITNQEGMAARIYWDRLSVFEARRRFAEDSNRLFNYAYAIVFAMAARAICQSGLHPSIGIHHHRQSNSFCLASDVMEPYRAVADAAVLRWLDTHKEETEVTSEVKKFLISDIMGSAVVMGDRRESFSVAVQRTSSSLRDSMFSNVMQLDVPCYVPNMEAS